MNLRWGNRPKSGSSRIGKKQIAAFLYPNQADAALAMALSEDSSGQAILGKAINVVFAHYDRPLMRQPPTMRSSRRSKLISAIRDESSAPRCRVGRRVFAGWFPSAEVDRLVALSQELDTPLNKLIEFGMEKLTGVAALPNLSKPDHF